MLKDGKNGLSYEWLTRKKRSVIRIVGSDSTRNTGEKVNENKEKMMDMDTEEK